MHNCPTELYNESLKCITNMEIIDNFADFISNVYLSSY